MPLLLDTRLQFVDETPNLALPYIVAAQAQKHVTHNEAIRALDAVVQIGALDRDLAAPPGSPANGDRYIVAPSASGAWLGKVGQIAAFQDGAWSFYAPREGWIAWVADEDQLYAWDGANWIVASGGSGSPTGSGGELQYNNGGSFGGATGVRWNDTSNKLEVDTSVELAATTAANAGVIQQAGNPLLHTYGTHNLFICTNAGNFALSGTENVGLGNLALLSLTLGSNNVAIGYAAAVSLTSGIGNFALGSQALANNASANANVAIGYLALNGLTGGSGANIAIGQQAGYQLSTGANNVLLGTGAGAGITTGSNNIIIGPLGGLSSTLASTVIIAPGGTERMRIDSSGYATFQGAVAPKSYTVATVPSAGAAGAGAMIYVSDESGGAVPAFSDGSDWRRVSDRAVIS